MSEEKLSETWHSKSETGVIENHANTHETYLLKMLFSCSAGETSWFKILYEHDP
jgi:hypothetical protein